MGQADPLEWTVAAAAPERPIGTMTAGATSSADAAGAFFDLVGFWVPTGSLA
jgi:hypothetical protein